MVLGIDGLGVECAVLLGGRGEVTERHAFIIAPQNAGRQHLLVGEKARVLHLARPVAHAHREEVGRSECIEVEVCVERNGRVLHGRDYRIGDDATDLDGRKVDDKLLRRWVARRGRDPVGVEDACLLRPREHDLSVPV